MAVLIVAARLCYQLDGSPRAQLPGVPPPPDWQGWARGVLACLRRQSALPLDTREARPLGLREAAPVPWPGWHASAYDDGL